MLYYFAYGSNMCTKKLRGSVPSAEPDTVGYIMRHTLAFDKVSQDGSAKCDAEETGGSNDRVYGVIFKIDPSEKAMLDLSEGRDRGYEEKQVEVMTEAGPRHAFTYSATAKDSSLDPYHWYKAYVVAGAEEHGLPTEYIAAISRVKSTQDSNEDRRAENEAILKGS